MLKEAYNGKRPPLHHLATNKNWESMLRGGPWSNRFDAIFKKAGMTLDDAANLIELPGHKGPHPERAHQIVYDILSEAIRGKNTQAARRQALLQALYELAIEATTIGTELNRLLTGT